VAIVVVVVTRVGENIEEACLVDGGAAQVVCRAANKAQLSSHALTASFTIDTERKTAKLPRNTTKMRLLTVADYVVELGGAEHGGRLARQLKVSCVTELLRIITTPMVFEGRRALDDGRCLMNNGCWTTDSIQRTTGDGRWTVLMGAER
jgi:hypothetical protein